MTIPVDPGTRRWTQTDITMLRDRSRAGDELTGIASLLQRTASDVQRMSTRLRIRTVATVQPGLSEPTRI